MSNELEFKYEVEIKTSEKKQLLPKEVKEQLENYINVIRSPKGIEQLKQLLDQHITLPDININQQHRWDFIKRLAILGDEKTSDYFSNEKISDNTDAGRLSAIAVEASLADESTKRKWLSLFMQQQNPLPLSHQRVAMASLFPPNQTALQEILLPPMLDALEEMYKTRDNYYQRSYAQDLFAGVCSVNGLSLMQTALDKNKIGTTLYKFLSENVQSTQECIKTKQ